jgi:hypothetical protein
MNRLITLTLMASLLVMTGCPEDEEPTETDTTTQLDTTSTPDTAIEPDVATEPDAAPEPDVAPESDATEPGPDDTATEDVAPDVAPEEDVEEDVEEPGPTSTTLNFWFIGAADAVFGQDEEALTLYPESESSEWAESPGVTMDVYAEAVGIETGATLKLYIDSAENQQTLLIASETWTGNATFNNVVLPKSVEGYDVSVEVAGVDGPVVMSKTVMVLTDGCQVDLAPAADGCMQDADGGAFELVVTAQVVSGDCDQATLSYRIGDDGETMAMDAVAVDADGNASFTLSLAAEGETVENSVYVDVVTSHPTSEALSGANSTVYNVDNGTPSLSFTQPDGVVITELTLNLDKDTAEAGLQFDVYGAVEGLSETDAGSLVLDINGVPWGAPATPALGGYSFADVTFMEDGPVTLTVTGTDQCGNVGTASVSVDVYAVQPVLSILAPTAGTILLAKGDKEPETTEIYETEFNIAAQSVADGTPVVVECKSTGGVAEATPVVTVTAGAEGLDLTKLPVALNTALYGQAITCTVRTTGQNPAVSNSVDLQVALPAPSFTIDTPAPNSHLTSRILDVTGAASNLNGQPVEVEFYDNGVLACALVGGTIADGLIAATFDLDTECEGVDDGTYFLKFDAVDALGNRFSELGDEPTFNVTFDTIPPELSRLAPADDLDPVGTPMHADASTAPGYQAAFIFKIQNEFNVAGSEVCLTVAGVPQAVPAEAQAGEQGPGCQVVDIQGNATWPEVTLQPGANVYEAWAYDGFGNPSQTYSGTINVDLEALAVSIIVPDPSGGTVYVATDTIDVTVLVADSDSGAEIAAATVYLQLNGTALSAFAPTIEGGAYTFTGIPLSGGSAIDEIVGAASFAGLDGASGTVQVAYKTSTPTVSIDAMPSVLNLASSQCAGSQQDCVSTVSATTTDVGEGSAGVLDVDCGNGVVAYDASVSSGGSLSFESVTLSHGGSCTLTAHVTDEAQQMGSSESASVSVDRVAPLFSSFNTPSELVGASGVLESLTNAGGDDKVLGPGIQHPLKVVAVGLEAGVIVTALLEWTDADTNAAQSRSLTSALIESVADNSAGTISFEDEEGSDLVDWPNGNLTISVSASDQAGNPATVLIATVLVQPDAPSLRIQVPLFPGETCTTSADCNNGTCHQSVCWTKWSIAEAKQMLLNLSGLSTTTDNLRVCSNASGLSATQPACEASGVGYYQIGTVLSVTEEAPTILLNEADLQEGFQTVVAELLPDAGGAWFSSLSGDDSEKASRRIYLDLSAPELVDPDGAGDMSAIHCDSDDQLPMGYLSYIEQEIADAEQQAGGTFQFTVNASEDGDAMVYVNGVEAQTVAIQSGVATFQLPLSTEGVASVAVQLSDLAGNLSVAVTDPTAETSIYVVDTVKPLISWAAPTGATLTQSDSLDIEVTCESGCEAGGTVTLSHGTKFIIGQATLVDGSAVFDHATWETFDQGGNELTATAVDTAFNSSAVISKSVFVDSVPPTASFTTVASYELADLPEALDGQADDADQATTPFDLAMTFEVGAGATSWMLELAACTGADVSTCGAGSQAAMGDVTGDTVISQTIGVPILSATSYHLLTVTAVDAVGNTIEATQAFRVDVAGCLVGLTDLASGDYLSTANACPGGTPCTDATLALTADYIACGAVDEIKLFNGASDLGSDTAVDDGSANFEVAIANGDTFNFIVKAYAGGVEQGASAGQVRTVDFTAPSVNLVETTVGSFTTPADQSTVVYGIGHDTNPATATQFEGHLAVSVTDANLAGGSVSALTATVGASNTDLTPSNGGSLTELFASADETRTFEDLPYTDQQDTTVTVTVRDAAGNEASSFFIARVDMVAPATPVLAAIDASDVNPRLPSVNLSWSAVDEDASSGGAASVYDIRYSTQPITSELEFEAACEVSALAHTGTLPTPGAPEAAESYAVTGPDPRQAGTCKFVASVNTNLAAVPTYYFALRVADAAGNWSGLASQSTDAMAHSTTRIVVHSEQASSTTFRTIYLGDVDGDEVGDIGFHGPAGNSVCVVYGGELGDEYNFADATTGANHDCVTDSTLNVAGATEIGTKIESLGDVNGDGLADFGASGRIDGILGFVAVYLGASGGPDLSNPDVVITGADPVVSKRYSHFCGAGNFTGEVNGATPIDSIALGEPGANLTGGLSVVPGNASWIAGMGAGAGPVVIDLESDTDKAAHNVLYLDIQFGDSYGNRCTSAGNVLPTPGDADGTQEDLLVYHSWGGDNRVFIHPGRAIPTGGATSVVGGAGYSADEPDGCLDGTTCDEDAVSVRLYQDLGPGSAATFGFVMAGGHDLTGDSVPDPVIGQPYRAPYESGDGRSVWVFDGAKLADAVGTAPHTVTLYPDKIEGSNTWHGVNGWAFEGDFKTLDGAVQIIGDFDGWMPDGKPTADIAVSSTDYKGVKLYTNHKDDVAGFPLGSFPIADVVFQHPTKGGVGNTMIYTTGGDVTGDGKVDIISSSFVGEVVIIY